MCDVCYPKTQQLSAKHVPAAPRTCQSTNPWKSTTYKQTPKPAGSYSCIVWGCWLHQARRAHTGPQDTTVLLHKTPELTKKWAEAA